MKKLTIITFFFILLILGGCMGEEQKVAEPSPSPAGTKKSKIETLVIYSINSDTMTLIPVSVKKETEDLSPFYIARLVQSNLNENDIELLDVYQKDKKVIVSFGSGGKPLKNCGDSMETLILEAFANSLLDNVKNCKKVIFRCEGKEYKSNQYSFGLNEVFASE